MKKKKVTKKAAPKKSRTPVRSAGVTHSLSEMLKIAQLKAEKCDLAGARQDFETVLKAAEAQKDLTLMMEAVSGCLRLAVEALDQKAIQTWRSQLDDLLQANPKQIPPVAWYNLGALSYHFGESMKAQGYFLRAIKAIRKIYKNSDMTATDEAAVVKYWSTLVAVLRIRGRTRRAELLARKLLEKFESKNYRGINGFLYFHLGHIEQSRGNYSGAREWYQKAHVLFLAEHNWYYHLYILYAYARLARFERNYKEAYWNLNLLEHATQGPEFGVLKGEVAKEKRALEDDAVDLLIDSRKCFITTREHGRVSLGKQYVLIQILEALTKAHDRGGDDKERGLSKAEIIRAVWHEDYRPEAHDNKLYYNINRLRRLLEPDVKQPKYLLNWKEGYRLAPGLRVHFVGKTEESVDSGDSDSSGTERRA